MEVQTSAGVFNLVNLQKVERVIDGQTDARGKMVKGVGKNAEGDRIIAEYDKIAGLILGKDGARVKTGSFWDFEEGQPRKKAEVVYVFRINGRVVELPAGEEMPLEVRAAQALENQEKKTKKSKK